MHSLRKQIESITGLVVPQVPLRKLAVWGLVFGSVVLAGLRAELGSTVSQLASFDSAETAGFYPFVLLLLFIPLLAAKRKVVLAGKGRNAARISAFAGLAVLTMAGLLLFFPYPLGLLSVFTAAIFAAVAVEPGLVSIFPLGGAFVVLTIAVDYLSQGLTDRLMLPYSLAVERLAQAVGFDISFSPYTFHLSGAAGPVTFGLEGACLGVAASALFVVFLAMLNQRMKLPLGTLVKASVAGLLLLQLANLLRILVLLQVGSIYGPLVFDQVHVEIGYWIFGAFYVLTWLQAFRHVRTSTTEASPSAVAPPIFAQSSESQG